LQPGVVVETLDPVRRGIAVEHRRAGDHGSGTKLQGPYEPGFFVLNAEKSDRGRGLVLEAQAPPQGSNWRGECRSGPG